MRTIVEIFGHVVLAVHRKNDLERLNAAPAIMKYLKAGGTLFPISSTWGHFEKSASFSDWNAWRELTEEERDLIFNGEPHLPYHSLFRRTPDLLSFRMSTPPGPPRNYNLH